ncbi:glycosyltransferase family 4 protein [Bradyrhizobium sp. SZCCHNRI30512]|uniref:glycosyltransferase family 4 protein n=2 Tax=unclassified Bradyrhizobium TaxID=2631580 RepID=UPI002916C718|nr:glycosyltransferase family 4 protein [Bradyrhizobium sp. SZCCHNRI30512]
MVMTSDNHPGLDVMEAEPAPSAQRDPEWSASGFADRRRLSILSVSHMPASPPRFGAQARMHGLMTQLARRHDLTAVMMVDDAFDIEECRRAMQAYCRDVVLVPNPYGRDGLSKRLLQLRSLVSVRSFDRLRVALPELQRVLDRVLRTTRFDVVNLEFPYLGHCLFRQAPAGATPPRLIIDSHEIAYDLARQFAATGASLGRRLYAGANWRKLRREEIAAYREADGVYLCSADDEKRLHDDIPNARTAVIPNAADVEFYQPRSTDPAPDGRTLVYFGLLSTVPNIDAVTHFVHDIWPRIAARHPDARCKIIGGRPPPALTALAGPRIELTGFVPDLRPHLAAAAAVIVPLRLGGGTRLKIVEAMAMGKAIVSTSLGAEGIEAMPGRDILIADEPHAFADAVNGLLAEPDLAVRIGGAARQVAVEKYAWSAAAQALEDFYCEILETRS